MDCDSLLIANTVILSTRSKSVFKPQRYLNSEDRWNACYKPFAKRASMEYTRYPSSTLTRNPIHKTDSIQGATPPLIGWMCMDSLMLGSLTWYRRLLNENVFRPLRARSNHQANRWDDNEDDAKLPVLGHAIAGTMAGWTVSFLAAPIEHVKARLQVQYQANKADRPYSGPIDCSRKILAQHGVRGLYHGLFATLVFRTFFFFWWGSYDVFTTVFQRNTNLSTPAINFWAGGLSAQVFWLTTYPSDVVKQRIMTDSLGPDRKFPRWRDAAVAVYRESGYRGYWRGFVPCFLRAFPANAMALVAFEGVMRGLK